MFFIKPMLANEVDSNKIPEYVFKEEFFFERKYDGDRLAIHIHAGTVAARGRNGQVSKHQEDFETSAWKALAASTSLEYILDGEYIDGILYVFDIPYLERSIGFETAFWIRREVLETVVVPGAVFGLPVPVGITECAKTSVSKALLAAECMRQKAEGVMIKNVNGEYAPGQRSSEILKAKFVKTADVVVDEVDVKGHHNCTFYVFDDKGTKISVGGCSLNGKPSVKPGDVIEVKYLYFKDKLVQARMLSVRTDKAAKECRSHQLISTNKNVVLNGI